MLGLVIRNGEISESRGCFVHGSISERKLLKLSIIQGNFIEIPEPTTTKSRTARIAGPTGNFSSFFYGN